MTENVVLTYLEKKRTHKYVSLDPITFGRIVLKHMGVNGECMAFEKMPDTDDYRIKWSTGNGHKCEALIDYVMLMNSLNHKRLTITMDVTDI